MIVKLKVGTHAAAISWVTSMALNSARTTEAVASYYGLVNGLRQAQIRAFVPLYVVGDNKAVINQLRVRRFPVRPRLSTLYREAREFANALSVDRWSHHSCEYNLMTAGAATATIANVACLWRRTLQTGQLCTSEHGPRY